MIEVVRSLPQGLFWYPLVLALTGLLLAAVVRLRLPRADHRAAATPSVLAFAAVADLMARARTDGYARRELERRVLGLVLQAHGYRGYSVESCRHLAEHGADPEVAALLREHLGDEPADSPSARDRLGGRTERLMSILETQYRSRNE